MAPFYLPIMAPFYFRYYPTRDARNVQVQTGVGLSLGLGLGLKLVRAIGVQIHFFPMRFYSVIASSLGST